jgi:hypothetical protein
MPNDHVFALESYIVLLGFQSSRAEKSVWYLATMYNGLPTSVWRVARRVAL